MKSIFLLCALGAVSDASECQADESSLLQARRTVRMTKATGSKNSMDLLKNMRHVANSLLEGSDTTMTADEVNDALEAASDALATLSPAIRQQIETAQQQINDAAAAVQVCHGQELSAQRSSLRESLQQRSAAVESCQDTLGQYQADETRQCGNAEDCLCDEARERTTAQETLCTALTETYEVAFCEHHQVCTYFHQCHALEAEVYQHQRADVEAEMALIVQEYIAVEQSRCLTGLIMQSMTPPRRPISHAALIACDDVDVSALQLDFPALPAEPAACPAHAHGDPECAAESDQPMINNWNFEQMTVNGELSGSLAEGRWIHFLNDGNSGLTNTGIPGWHQMGTRGGASGLFNSRHNEIAAEGSHVLFLNNGDDNNYVYQDLLQPFTRTLDIETAVCGGNSGQNGGYRFGLYTQDGTLVQEHAAGVNGAPLCSGSQYLVTHMTVSVEDHRDVVGQTLQLRLMKNRGGQGHYHYIRFT